MEKHILHWSYWLGIASLIIAVVWKALSAFGLRLPMLFTRDQSIFYLTFYKASLLLLVAAIASANYAWLKSHRLEKSDSHEGDERPGGVGRQA